MSGVRLMRMAMASAMAAAIIACAETPVDPDGRLGPRYAKPSPPAPDATITIRNFDAQGGETDVRSDGRGAYNDLECGVSATVNDRDGGETGSMFAPAAFSLTREQLISCVSPRSGSLRLLVRHVSDDPHVDDSTAPLGSFNLSQIKLILDRGIGVVNAGLSCLLVNKGGKAGGRGLRFDPVGFPGSSALEVTQLGAATWRVGTRPNPDNLAYCENNDGISFWHVIMELEIEALT